MRIRLNSAQLKAETGAELGNKLSLNIRGLDLEFSRRIFRFGLSRFLFSYRGGEGPIFILPLKIICLKNYKFSPTRLC